jgi:hypothetical protein
MLLEITVDCLGDRADQEAQQDINEYDANNSSKQWQAE